MKNKNISTSFIKFSGLFVLMLALGCFSAQPLVAQTPETVPDENQLKSLRSDVGIIGLTANFDFLNKFEYLDDDNFSFDGSSDLEIVLRDVRMMSPRLGVGFQILTSFFTNDAEDQPSFGIGSWGVGPVVRLYPFWTDRFQPYVQANSLFGNNLGAGDLADTREAADGFRVRLGLRAGIAYRLTNRFGLFVEAGPDWESSRIFRADTRVWQVNVGVDLYRFN